MITAHSIGVTTCTDPKCKCVHIVMYDEGGSEVAQAAVRVGTQVEQFVNSVQAKAMVIAVMKE
jgi:hypothetical protein